MKTLYNRFAISQRKVEALEMAIKALEEYNNKNFTKLSTRVLDPNIGDIVFLKIGKDKYKSVKIISGSFFKNGRISNFWVWTDVNTDVEEYGYGEFYI